MISNESNSIGISVDKYCKEKIVGRLISKKDIVKGRKSFDASFS